MFRVLSEAETKARHRNHRIRMLRGLYANALSYLTGPRMLSVLAEVDAELAELGAQLETVRRRENRRAAIEGIGYYKGYGKRRKFVMYEEAL